MESGLKFISNTAKIHTNVIIGENCTIGEFVIIGEPASGLQSGQRETIIGENALIRSHTVIYAGNRIGNDFQTGHAVVIREENEIGNNVSIGTGSILEHHIKVADNVRLHSNVFVPEYTVLEEQCWLGPCVVLTNAKYPASLDAKNNLKGALIKRKAKIGANATILPGIIVGDNALIGAGSVVTKNVPQNTIVAGNPARMMRDMEDSPYSQENQ